MKRIKFLLLPLSFLFLLGFVSCSDDKDDDIKNYDVSFSDLPQPAQEFVKEYFSYTVVSRIWLINDDGLDLYEVNFADGCEVVFNTDGSWQEVDAHDGKTIPSGITPEPIVQYLDEYYQDYGINEINKTGYGYLVELTTNVDLMFSPIGQFLGVKND